MQLQPKTSHTCISVWKQQLDVPFLVLLPSPCLVRKKQIWLCTVGSSWETAFNTQQVQSIRTEYIQTDQIIWGLLKEYLLYHIWSIVSHFPPGSDALFTEGVITVGQDPKDILSWRLFFINIVHADSTGHGHLLPGVWGSSCTIILICCITDNCLLETNHSRSAWLNRRHSLVKAFLNTWDTVGFCSNSKSVPIPRGHSESVKKVSQ